jgi:hypothetical protein
MQNEPEIEKKEDGTPMNPAAPEAQPAVQNEGEVTAESVTIRGKASMVNAHTVAIDGGQVGVLRGEDIDVDLKNGGIGALFGGKVRIDVDNGGVGSVMAREVTINAPSVGSVIALNVSGDVKPKVLIDMRAGLVAGAVAGLVIGLFSLLTGRGKRRCK